MSALELETEMMEVVRLDPTGPRVVAIGGGHGLEQALVGVQSYASRIDAVVTVADDGGSSGRLTSAFSILPPGDIRRCLLALSPEPSLWSEMFEFRFETSDVAGHSLGNLILAAMSELFGDFETAISIAEEALGSIGHVIPNCRRSLHLQAVIDGVLVDGQAAIATSRGAMTELRLQPADETVNPRALEVVAAADQIVIGPGSIYTSVASALLVPGLAEAVNEASADVVYVCNLTTQDGESLGMGAADHVRALLEFGGVKTPLTALIHQGGPPFPAEAESVAGDEEEVLAIGVKPVFRDLLDRSYTWPQHDPMRLGRALEELWQAWHDSG
ncbi:MAG: uridine diphosphate-N-acetylglucosamine-binding protein YvcK [Acidimicrobiia bacterium]|nr:uridine diphosphate-N-acetylglucosamine-binding protein YvcK [Acidimicrobiia bacterium]MBT8247236.1 uridine diphosphate-N-acetylglucosamine-binding protein YvcK [Acidimicrobiia bacterium]NNF88059.1 uridine diphosphate-N-acetylglucosamine-binding protein YvcK [Acidimicrobiia bacterium]NNL12070.1 uridine diphosphate-N-acetylglucosamine-binding protein YvcK [Acidimicrobiia bacterium]NNL96757.1 uridine diphosphate-N-acetylglucosamine-binding protein YvcK [Acidimicrobiia bacterium]